MSEPTEADLIKTATGFLMSAPPGEFMEVVTDVRALLPRESLLNDSAAETFKRYNEDQMVQVDSQDRSHKVLITKYGCVGGNQYLDHAGGSVVTFDHIKQEITATRPISGEGESDLEPLRAAFERATQQYVAEQFQFGTGAVFASREGLTVCISSARFNPGNYWNGRWRSVWTVPVSRSGNVTINGKMRVQVHYYEDGNVQLNTEGAKKISAAASSDANAFAAAALKAIAKAEQGVHQSIDASYNTLGENTFKALRRPLPISHQKINWNLIRSYRLGQDVQGAPQ
eukprot:m51a1_g2526 putative subunit of heterodimeric actin capping protein cap32 34 (285) ;mRNA; r:232822-234142